MQDGSVTPDSGRRLRVFVCHSSSDKPAVRDLYHKLQSSGFEPWLDEEDLLPGQDWRQEIPSAIRHCDVVIVCLSSSSVSKEGYVQKEIAEALSVAEEKPEGTIFIIPVKLEEEVSVPLRLSQWHCANLGRKDGYEKLVRALRQRATKILTLEKIKGDKSRTPLSLEERSPASSMHHFTKPLRNRARALLSRFSDDLAIDLGTTRILVFAHGKGVVVMEPSIVAINKNTGEVEAVGKEAKVMLGRKPGSIVVVKPMKDGFVADFKVTEKMLNYFIQKGCNREMLARPRVVIAVPSEMTQVEKRAVMDLAYRAKASEVHLVEKAMLAAIGAGLPIEEPSGNMIVDIGGGTTDIAVTSLSRAVYSRSVRVAGNKMDEAIMNYFRRKYNVLIGEYTAEQVKIGIGSAYPLEKPLTMEIKGRSHIEGVPKAIIVDDVEIREALSECVATIMNAIRVALERTPPELSADISDRGIVLSGGGALLKNLDKRIREETGLPVSIADDPQASTMLGAGKILSDFNLVRAISTDPSR